MRHSPRLLAFATVAMMTACLPLAICQSPAGATAFDPRATMQSAAELLVEGHISHHPVDGDYSQKAFVALFDELDPLRVFFLQSDIDELRGEERQLGEYLLAGDDGFALRVQTRYENRIGEAAELAKRLLAVAPDFTVDESLAADGKQIAFAKSKAELEDRWRQHVKLDRLALEFNGIQGDAVTERLQKRYTRMTAERGTPLLATERFLDAITSVYDPHTTYFSPRAAADFAMMTRLNYEGIGAVLGSEDGHVTIAKLLDGSARASGEVKVGDVILALGRDDDSAMESVDGWETDDVVDRIRGPRGTFVRLQLVSGAETPRLVKLERRKTELADQFASGKVLEEGSQRIGWIDLPGFYADPEGGHSATRDVARLLEDFAAKDVGCVVLDLRTNGGGLLTEAVSLTGLFLNGGNVVRVENSTGRDKRLDDPDPKALWQGPLLVLTSRFSASASEILAGAIQDNGRGLVVGDTMTHGKGTVQSVIDLADYPAHRGDHPSGTLKLTIQQFFRPGGASTQRRGVHADIVLPAWSESVAEGEDADANALPFRAIESLVDGETKLRNADLVASLAEASAKRVAGDADFVAVDKANLVRERLREQKRIPLERSAYTAYRQANKVSSGDDDPAKEPDYYRTEVCKVAVDYAARLHGHVVASDR